jgi:hypothetical protein
MGAKMKLMIRHGGIPKNSRRRGSALVSESRLTIRTIHTQLSGLEHEHEHEWRHCTTLRSATLCRRTSTHCRY